MNEPIIKKHNHTFPNSTELCDLPKNISEVKKYCKEYDRIEKEIKRQLNTFYEKNKCILLY